MELDLDRFTSPQHRLVAEHPSGKLRCLACAHRCLLADGKRGVCRVRSRVGDALAVPWGYTAGLAADPIEKKPFFHVLPGTDALSFGMLGCDLRCPFCQNWVSSQVLRDAAARARLAPATAEQLVGTAVARRCRAVVSTYNEPLITAEWAAHVFTRARREGLLTGFVSNGHGTAEVVELLKPVTDLFKVDLKAFREAAYRQLGGSLRAVTRTIERLSAAGFWVEVVTLVVPGFNDDEGELRELAEFVAGVSVDIPWHVTAFHPDYQVLDRGRTPARTLVRALEIGRDAGLHFVYAGNLPGAIEHAEDTLCPGCGRVLVERLGFSVITNRMGPDGRCPGCGAVVPGVWAAPSGSR
jgi:pyruvate formate lyase activating enzyme